MLESEGLTKVRASWTPFAHRRETAKPSYVKQRHSQAKPKHDPTELLTAPFRPGVHTHCPLSHHSAYAQLIFKGHVIAHDHFYQAFPSVSTASNKCGGIRLDQWYVCCTAALCPMFLAVLQWGL